MAKEEVLEFPGVVTELLPFYPGVTSLSLSPGGVVRHAVPAEGNEGLLGFDQLADPLQGLLGQPVVVENRPGAGGNLGALAVAQAEKDAVVLHHLVEQGLQPCSLGLARVGHNLFAVALQSGRHVGFSLQ